jgi:hypothetical protein
MTKVLENVGKIWTDEERDRVARLAKEGYGLEVICRAVGRTPAGVLSQMVSMKILFMGKDGHYYKMPEEPWAMWQESKHITVILRNEVKDDRSGHAVQEE